MAYRLKIKLTFAVVLAIAQSSSYAIVLLPRYAIASFFNNSTQGWTQPNSQFMADLPPPPDGTPDGNGQQPPGGTPHHPPDDTGTPDGNGPRTPGGTPHHPPDGSRTPGETPDNLPNGRRTPRVYRNSVCGLTDKALTALVPENAKGLTTAEHPVFWFYIPGNIHSIEFVLLDRNGTALYETSLQLTQTPGVIGIPLPPSTVHIKLNESYQWYLVADCDQEDRSEEDVLELDGWVTRVQQSPNPENSPNIIWYDALTNLAQRYLAEPQNLEVKKAWTELLQSVGLEELAQEPLTQLENSPM